MKARKVMMNMLMPMCMCRMSMLYHAVDRMRFSVRG